MLSQAIWQVFCQKERCSQTPVSVESEGRHVDDLEVPKVDGNNWVKTMEATVLTTWFYQRSMVQSAIQHGVYRVLHLSLSWQFKTNKYQLRYRKLRHNLYNNTMFANAVSRRNNKCTQIFATGFGWSCLFAIKLKSEAHKALPFPFHWVRMPPTIICDNAKEMVHCEFTRKLNETSCHLRQTEPFTQWLNAAGRKMKTKEGYGRKMIKSKEQKRLWDDCHLNPLLEQTLCILYTNWTWKFPRQQCLERHSTKASFLILNGLNGWCFQDKTALHIHYSLKLVRNLGWALMFGPAIMAKILKSTKH